MTRTHWVVLLSCTALFLGLVVLYKTGAFKPVIVQAESDISTAFNLEAFMTESRGALDSLARLDLTALEAQKASASSPQAEIVALKAVSKFWNEQDNFLLGGHFAKQVAQMEQADSSWAITGTTFSLVIFNPSQAADRRAYCVTEAKNAFDQAIKLAPSNTDYQINKALILIEASQIDASVAPMEGIGILRGIVEKDPGNSKAIYHLGRLAMKSGQFDKAIERFNQIVSIDTLSGLVKSEAWFWIAESNKSLGKAEDAKAAYSKAIELADPSTKIELERILKEFVAENK